MHSSSVAEWIIRRIVDQNRADSIIGDLVEERDRKGNGWFWFAVAGVIVSQMWRRALAFAAALYIGLYSLGGLQMPIYGVHAAHRPPHSWMPVFALLSGLGILLSFGAPYVSIRYGAMNSFVHQMLAVWVLSGTLIFYWWIPAVRTTCIVFGIVFFVYSAMSTRGRLAASALTVVLCLSFVGGSLTELIFGGLFYAYFAITRNLPNQTIVNGLGDIAAFFGVLLQTSIYSRVHRRYVEARYPFHTAKSAPN